MFWSHTHKDRFGEALAELLNLPEDARVSGRKVHLVCTGGVIYVVRAAVAQVGVPLAAC